VLGEMQYSSTHSNPASGGTITQSSAVPMPTITMFPGCWGKDSLESNSGLPVRRQLHTVRGLGNTLARHLPFQQCPLSDVRLIHKTFRQPAELPSSGTALCTAAATHHSHYRRRQSAVPCHAEVVTSLWARHVYSARQSAQTRFH
jgi:hypothetical protein